MSPAAFLDAASAWALSPGYRRAQPDVRPPMADTDDERTPGEGATS